MARWWVLAEIATHFRVLYAISAFAALIALSAGRHWRWVLASAGVLAWHASAIVPWYFPPSGPVANGSAIKIFSANVNADNTNYDAVLAQIRREQADLVFIQEISSGWATALEALRDTHPYRAIAIDARTPYFGMAVYSRFPLENVDTGDPVNEEVPIIRADAVVGKLRVHLVNVHLSPPEGGWLSELRYKQYPWLTKYVSARSGPILIAGDFNCTVWSPLYRDLARSGPLVNARQGHGILPSWYPIVGPIHLIPIDQILAGGGIRFTDARLGSRIGSDHCPMVAEFRLPE